MNIIGPNACRARRNTLGTTRVVFVGAAFLMANLASTILAGADLPAAPPRISHPLLVLKDAAGKNVLESGEPISTRQTCGGCHDYDFITDSFHFQQGKNEMNPKLLASHGIAPFNSSPGMFGKFSIIPNRQLTHAGVADRVGLRHEPAGVAHQVRRLPYGRGNLRGRPRRPPLPHPGGQGERAPRPQLHGQGPRLRQGRPLGLGQERGRRERLLPLSRAQGQPGRPTRSDGGRELPLGGQRDARRHGDRRQAGERLLHATTAPPSTRTARSRPRPSASPNPTLENCAQCHGFTAKNTTIIQPIQHADIMRGTEKAGWIYNGAKISDTVTPDIVGPGEDGLPLGRARGEGPDLHRLPFLAQQPRAHDPDRPDQEPQLPARHERHRRLPQAPGPQLRPRQHPARDGEHDAPRHHAGVSRTATTRRRATPSCRTRACTSRRWRARRATSPTSTSGPTAATSGAS